MLRAALLAVVLAACSVGGEPPDLTVYAAASLADAVAETAVFETVGGVGMATSTGASSALRTQIEQGAPADVFLSADTANPEALAAAGLTDGPPEPFAANGLVIVVAREAYAEIDDPFDLANDGLRIVAAGERVPISRYAAEAIQAIAALPDAPPGYAAEVEANVVSREDDVRAVLSKIELGEGDAAFVYATEALAAGDAVTTIALPDAVDVRAEYAGVVLRTSAVREEGHAYLDWLAGPEGRAILARYGFRPPP
jgi:molybdate transport system substrate-binding protein